MKVKDVIAMLGACPPDAECLVLAASGERQADGRWVTDEVKVLTSVPFPDGHRVVILSATPLAADAPTADGWPQAGGGKA